MRDARDAMLRRYIQELVYKNSSKINWYTQTVSEYKPEIFVLCHEIDTSSNIMSMSIVADMEICLVSIKISIETIRTILGKPDMVSFDIIKKYRKRIYLYFIQAVQQRLSEFGLFSARRRCSNSIYVAKRRVSLFGKVYLNSCSSLLEIFSLEFISECLLPIILLLLPLILCYILLLGNTINSIFAFIIKIPIAFFALSIIYTLLTVTYNTNMSIRKETILTPEQRKKIIAINKWIKS